MTFKFNPFTNTLDLTGASGGVAFVETLTGDSGVATPVANNINVYGTTTDAGSGIETEGAGDTLSVRMHTPFDLSDFEFRSATSGATRTLSVTNTSNTASSQATTLISVAGGTAGDAWQQFSVGATQSYAIGIDNSDSDILKITQAAAGTINPSSGATLQQFDNANTRVLFPLQGLALATSLAGSPVNLLVQNVNAAANSDAVLSLQTAAAAGGSSYIAYTGPADNWFVGVDGADSESYKITTGAVGTFPLATVAMRAATNGNVSFPQDLSFEEGLIGHLTVPGAYPYDVLGTDYVVSVDTSAARTIRLPDAPTTGKIFVIKDVIGSAAANNISLTTVGGAVNIDGATTYTMNVNYQSVTVIFSGSAYFII